MPVVQSCNVHHTDHLGRGEEGEREEGGGNGRGGGRRREKEGGERGRGEERIGQS